MTTHQDERTRPPRQQQAAAWLAYASLALAVMFLVVVSFRRWEVVIAGLVTLAALVVAAWFAVSRRRTTRLVALGAGAAALVLFVWLMVASGSVRVLVVGLLLLPSRPGRHESPSALRPSTRTTSRPHLGRATRCSS